MCPSAGRATPQHQPHCGPRRHNYRGHTPLTQRDLHGVLTATIRTAAVPAVSMFSFSCFSLAVGWALNILRHVLIGLLLILNRDQLGTNLKQFRLDLVDQSPGFCFLRIEGCSDKHGVGHFLSGFTRIGGNRWWPVVIEDESD